MNIARMKYAKGRSVNQKPKSNKSNPKARMKSERYNNNNRKQLLKQGLII